MPRSSRRRDRDSSRDGLPSSKRSRAKSVANGKIMVMLCDMSRDQNAQFGSLQSDVQRLFQINLIWMIESRSLNSVHLLRLLLLQLLQHLPLPHHQQKRKGNRRSSALDLSQGTHASMPVMIEQHAWMFHADLVFQVVTSLLLMESLHICLLRRLRNGWARTSFYHLTRWSSLKPSSPQKSRPNS